MQNEQTLIELGFKKIHNTDEWLYRGKIQKFTARVGYDNKFVDLYLVSDKVDNRQNSPNKGKYLRSKIKDCCSINSVKNAIQKFDIESDKMNFGVGYITIK